MVRNPIERIISIYLMGHPGSTSGTGSQRWKSAYDSWNTLFYNCFPSLNAFAEGLPSARPFEKINFTESAAINSSCAKLNWKTVRGADTRATHFYWNYQAYAKPILDWNAGRQQLSFEVASNCSAKPIYVIRTEELSHDWGRIEELIGAEGKTATPNTHMRDGKSQSALSRIDLYNRNISRGGLYKLCSALAEEMAVYEELLHLAVNLVDQEREVDYERVRSQCPGHHSLFAAIQRRQRDPRLVERRPRATPRSPTVVQGG
jgi:hypothetical protein